MLSDEQASPAEDWVNLKHQREGTSMLLWGEAWQHQKPTAGEQRACTVCCPSTQSRGHLKGLGEDG